MKLQYTLYDAHLWYATYHLQHVLLLCGDVHSVSFLLTSPSGPFLTICSHIPVSGTPELISPA